MVPRVSLVRMTLTRTVRRLAGTADPVGTPLFPATAAVVATAALPLRRRRLMPPEGPVAPGASARMQRRLAVPAAPVATGVPEAGVAPTASGVAAVPAAAQAAPGES